MTITFWTIWLIAAYVWGWLLSFYILVRSALSKLDDINVVVFFSLGWPFFWPVIGILIFALFITENFFQWLAKECRK